MFLDEDGWRITRTEKAKATDRQFILALIAIKFLLMLMIQSRKQCRTWRRKEFQTAQLSGCKTAWAHKYGDVTIRGHTCPKWQPFESEANTCVLQFQIHYDYMMASNMFQKAHCTWALTHQVRWASLSETKLCIHKRMRAECTAGSISFSQLRQGPRVWRG